MINLPGIVLMGCLGLGFFVSTYLFVYGWGKQAGIEECIAIMEKYDKQIHASVIEELKGIEQRYSKN